VGIAACGIQHPSAIFRPRDERETVDYCSEASKCFRIAPSHYLDVVPVDITAVTVRVAELCLKLTGEKVIDREKITPALQQDSPPDVDSDRGRNADCGILGAGDFNPVDWGVRLKGLGDFTDDADPGCAEVLVQPVFDSHMQNSAAKQEVGELTALHRVEATDPVIAVAIEHPNVTGVATRLFHQVRELVVG